MKHLIKRSVALLCAAVFAASLTACGQSSKIVASVASAAPILLIGYEDISVDKNVDGYTGATTRNLANDMVTYIASN